MAANTPMQEYTRAVIEWRVSSEEYERALLDAAEANAEHKAARAKRIVTIRHEDAKMSHALAEAVGDADDEVIRLSRLKLVKEAQVEGLKQRLLWHRSNADMLRTQVVDERASNAFQSQAGAGAGRTTFEPTEQRGTVRRDEPIHLSEEPPRRSVMTPENTSRRPTW